MKKFEVINNEWIKGNFGNSLEKIVIRAMKINTISVIDSQNFKNVEYSITLRSNCNECLWFAYNLSEKKQYEADLCFLENLLFKNKN